MTIHLPSITLHGLPGIPNVQPGDDIASLILEALTRAELTLQAGDVLVITQKIVSKAERRAVRLADVTPSPQARDIAQATGKDPRLVEVILRESRGVIRQRGPVLITETRHGWICANAGVDRSNIAGPEGESALPLPLDADESARRIRAALMSATGADIAVIITDTHGRAWREGTVNLALGVAGMLPITDLRGQPDMFGYTLRVTTVARADELAAAAGLITGQAAERLPVVLIRGADYPRGEGHAVDMQRPPEQDLFR
ncbi:MAG: coenzyme F420-0:L-glutamate ligase [Chloroflexi bacterium]|jgi:coenzyme F420-0:L-glutamate ligase/coenzyme F420-1:gamma-L-glutamate ligase|nr:coenzyme F420-0:L-glutamate ligase [Chloroflexota bacterium]